jgi:hypothetical protein
MSPISRTVTPVLRRSTSGAALPRSPSAAMASVKAAPAARPSVRKCAATSGASTRQSSTPADSWN